MISCPWNYRKVFKAAEATVYLVSLLMNVYYSSTPLRLYFDLKKMEDSHHKDLQVNEKVARMYKPRLTVIPFFDLK